MSTDAAIVPVAIGDAAFRQVFDVLPIPMWLFDPATLRFVEVNAAAVTAYGWSRETLLGMKVTDLTPGADAVADDMADAVEASAPGAGRCRHRTAGGVLRDVRWVASAVEADGRDLVFVSAQDDTDAVRTERDARRLAVSEARFRGLAEAMPVLVYAKRADGSGYANQQHLDFIGKTQDELAAASWIDRLHPDDIARVRAERAVSIRDLAAMQTEFRGRAADGSYRWLLGRFAPLREADGSVTWIGAAMDIDDRRRADAELRLLAQAMACVRDYIMILRVDPLSPADNTIIFANQAVIDRTGYARDELVEHPYSQLLGDGSDVPAMLTRLRAAMLERRQIRIEMAQVARDKSIFWIDADVIPMFDAFDNFTHVVAVGRDITARKAADEEVFHSSPGLN